MHARQRKLLETFIKVDEFLTRNREVGERVVNPRARENFLECVKRMAEHMNQQDAFKRFALTSTSTKRKLRDRLIDDHMRPLAVVASAGMNDMERKAFTIPERKQPFLDHVAAGHGMAAAAKEREEVFLAHGFPADFIAQLLAATEELNRAITMRSKAKSLRVNATAGIKAEADAALVALRVIDSQIRRAIKDDNILLTQWESVSHLTRVRSRSVRGARGAQGVAAVGTVVESSAPVAGTATEVVVETTVEPAAESVVETVVATLEEIVVETVTRTEVESGAETLARILDEGGEAVSVEVPRLREAA